MSNVLKVSLQTTIYSLAEKGWSQRRIARELGIDRETVGRYLRLQAKPAISITGGDEAKEPKPAISISGSPDESQSGEAAPIVQAEKPSEAKPAISISGKSAGRRSYCDRFASWIEEQVEAGLSAQRIYQELAASHGFSDSYQSVQRFVRKIKERQPERVWRMECQPGEEAQVDFGLGAPIYNRAGSKGRRTWVFRVVLSWSRKGYSEAVLRQDTETFLRCLENAIRSFGGAPLMLNVDNLKAAVLKADWFDPEINPKLAEFCRHYGMHVVPCRPCIPEHKGKVERGIAYVRGNALKGRRFASLAEENRFLAQWESTVADKRIHGTTRKQVAASFEEERPHLTPLPATLFPCFQEARRSVHRDSYVEVERAFYEVPPELIGREVWVRWDGRCVRVFNEHMEQVAMHTRIEAGRFSRTLGAGGFSAPVRTSCNHWISRAAVLGECCGEWAQAAVQSRGPEALRSIMALCGMIKQHSAATLNAACGKAIENGTLRLKDLRRLIGEKAEQRRFDFGENHPLIRDLKTYSEFINQNHTSQPQTDPQHSTPSHDPQHPQTTRPEAEPVRAA